MDELDRWNFWSWRKPTKKVEGGIKARTPRFGESWWAARWLEIMQSKSVNRLARGRTYARKGQITEFSVKPGKITGKIQGSAEEPYEVKIWAPVVKDPKRHEITKEIKTHPLFAAKFLNQEMPAELPGLFQKADEDLFPSPNDLLSDCDCPDAVNPCKHIAAIFYLFSLELETDPMLLLFFRGFDLESLLVQSPSEISLPNLEQKGREPLPADAKVFWKPFRSFRRDPSNPPRENALLMKQLGNFPLWRGEADLIKTLERIYANASNKALEWL